MQAPAARTTHSVSPVVVVVQVCYSFLPTWEVSATQKEFTVCNVCEDVTRGTKEYKLAQGGRETVVDLCEEHSEPLERFLPTRASVTQRRVQRRPTKSTTRTTRRRTPIMTMAEIEATKATQA